MDQGRPVRLKILSYNIHKGFSVGNRRFVLERIRQVLEICDADLVFLQEVLGEHTRHAETVDGWPMQGQFEFLADNLWPHFAYGKNAIYSSGHHGNAILSKHGFVSWENIDVSNNKLERRGLLHCVVKPPGFEDELHLICLHLDLREYGRRQQVLRLCDRVSTAIPPHAPVIIAGDFNDWRHRAGRMLEDTLGVVEAHKSLHGHYAASFPSWMPFLRLDRIYLRGLVPRVAEAMTGRPWNELSDHTPLFSELQLQV